MSKFKNSSIQYRAPGKFEEARFEKVHNVIFDNSVIASKKVASEIATLIKAKQEHNEPCVLGLATGSSPIKIYEELVRMHHDEGLSFKNVVTFNLDEYIGIDRLSRHSYYHFMCEHLFNHVDILMENVHIPDGLIPQEKYTQYCAQYEQKILQAGGLDFQLLGIGRTGHIGFNEPGSHVNSVTRVVALNHVTRLDAASSFLGIEHVPRKAITMGISSVYSAKRIVLLAWGENKASVIRKTIEGEISSDVPATYLQSHPNTTFVLDQGAAAELTRIQTPWVVGDCTWNEQLIIKAVVWLSTKLSKSVLKLTDNDYSSHGMASLLTEEGSSYALNIRIFNKLQHTITGWPGGKPNSDDSTRPERATPKKKRVLVLSPHPDDDVISMGGTLDRLISQGHEVHVAYQTSGNIAVTDEEALKYAYIAAELNPESTVSSELIRAIREKGEGDIDEKPVRHLKGLIRRNECYLATEYLGLERSYVHFLDMPFYETGKVKKNKVGEQDYEIIENIVDTIKPHQIYAAGDLADPHGTHKVCLDALFEVIDRLKSKTYMKDCWVWLYRGAWEEWKPYEIDMAVPLSPEQVLRKRNAIFYHQSQKDGVMFQGDDTREFWVRAEDRNRRTAEKYNQMGLADYAAIEAFKRYYF